MTFKEERPPREGCQPIGNIDQVEHLAWIDFFTHFPGITLTRANYILEAFRFTSHEGSELIVHGWSIHAAIHYMYMEWGVLASNDDLMDAAEHLLNFFDRVVECGGRVRLVLEDESNDGMYFADDPNYFDVEWLLFLMGEQDENPLESGYYDEEGDFVFSEDDKEGEDDPEDRFADDDTTGDFEYAAPENPRIGESVEVDDDEVVADTNPGFEGVYVWEDNGPLEDFFSEIPTVTERFLREARVRYHLERFLRLRGYRTETIFTILYDEELVRVNPNGNSAMIRDRDFDRANKIGGSTLRAVSDLNLWFHTSEAPFMPIERADEIIENIEGSN